MGDDAIVADNVRAVGALHVSAMFDAMKMYEVVDRLVALASMGRLPLGGDDGARRVEQYVRRASERLSAAERRGLYARVLGITAGTAAPGGTATPRGTSISVPNRAFDGLWTQFVTSVSAFGRRQPEVGQEHVRTRAQALARNLSAHGDGLPVFAHTLAAEVSALLDMLRIDAFQQAFGVHDVWSLVERVSSQELGAAPDVVRRRTMAEQGARIFAWLATRPAALWTGGGDALDAAAVASQRCSPQPTSTPTDYDLVDACERWLAIAGDGGPERG